MAANDVVTELMNKAKEMRRLAYCPYSDFRVGAAVLCDDNTMYSGCNVENASYGLSVCAERVAIMVAVANGKRNFKALAVCCDVQSDFKASCGACRQFIAEFGSDIDLYLVKPNGEYKCVQFATLLPMAFTPAALQEKRDKS